MSKRGEILRALVTERLTAAAEEIFAVVERTIAEYEEELCGFKEENQRKQQILDQILSSTAGAGLKQENDVDPQIHEGPGVQVKEEHPTVLHITGVATETNTGFATGTDTSIAMETARGDTVVAPIWTIPLTEDTAPDGGRLETLTEVPESKISVKKRNVSKSKTKACQVCNKRFSRDCDLKRHETVHTGRKPYSCLVCDRSFLGESYVKVHMRVHTGELPFTCPQCAKCFGTKGALNLHLRTIHTLLRPFSCSVCARTFKTKGHLKEHMLRHTEFRPLTCPICGRGYWRRRELDIHLARHAKDRGERPSTSQKSH